MNIEEKAQEYAQNKMQVLNDAVAEAYLEGYKQGYEDGKAGIPVECNDDDIEYVDLGLPSGTLWAKDYVEEDGDTLYLPYDKAKLYNIPNIEKIRELFQECACNYCDYGYRQTPYTMFKGPNGNILKIYHGKGFIKEHSWLDTKKAWFWVLNSDSSKTCQPAVCLEKKGKSLSTQFKGCSLPVLLVK